MNEFIQRRLCDMPEIGEAIAVFVLGYDPVRVSSVTLCGEIYTRVSDGAKTRHFEGDMDVRKAAKAFHKAA